MTGRRSSTCANETAEVGDRGRGEKEGGLVPVLIGYVSAIDWQCCCFVLHHLWKIHVARARPRLTPLTRQKGMKG